MDGDLSPLGRERRKGSLVSKVSKLTLIIDSREQKPLEFKEGVFDEIVTRGVPTGDYWAELDGKELPLCFERKGLNDLFSTMTGGYQRFKRELQRAEESKLKVVLLIEGSMLDVFNGVLYSDFSGESMLKKLGTMYVRYGLEWYCFNNRREMAKFIEITFSAFKRNYSTKAGE
jgi:ERCC4-type nuclease